MTLQVEGLHHFTAIAGNPTENAKFYVNKLGMRMVKKTVNHDAPEMYHLFYGDKEGTPGSGITFFPGMAEKQGKSGAGMITELGLRMPKKSINYWKKHLEEEKISFEEEKWREKTTLKIEDPDGLKIRIVPAEKQDDYTTWENSTVPEKHQLRGMNHVKLSVRKKSGIEPILNRMGLEKSEDDYENTFYDAKDSSCVEIEEVQRNGTMGRGSVHHIAFKAGDSNEIEKWREKLARIGMRPSPAISRKYFTSTYARTPVGILFEFSSMGPGYTADESVEELGTNFVLPEKLQDKSDHIINNLPEFREEEINQ